jgi:hypothetical protein
MQTTRILQKDRAIMSRRLPGSLLLILLALGLFFTRSAWAGSDGAHTANVMVHVSPLKLLMENAVTVKVGEFTCDFVDSFEPSSVCWDLPAGEYEVSATSEGYIVSPSTYHINLESGTNNPFYFRFFEINHQLYMPNVQVGR